ncbi:MAG: hypothetical protein ABI528_09435 [bacterium]
MKKTISHIEYRKQLSTLRDLIILIGITQEFYENADSYLHYSNKIVFNSTGIIPAASLISIKFFSTVTEQLLLLLILQINRTTTTFINCDIIPNAFEGVIERYCGVPP